MVQELKGLLADQARKVLRHGRSASPRNGATVTHCAWHTIKRQRVQESDDELFEVEEEEEVYKTEQDEDGDVVNPLVSIINIDNNLMMYLESLENKLQQGKLDDYTFLLESLLVKYKQALIHKR